MTTRVSSRPFEVHVVSTAIKLFRVVTWKEAQEIKEKWKIEHTEPEDRVRISEDPNDGYFDVECFYGEHKIWDIQTQTQAEESAERLKDRVPNRRVEIYRKIHGGEKLLLKTL